MSCSDGVLEELTTSFGPVSVFTKVKLGVSNRPPLIFLHGLFSNSALFDQLTNELSTKHFPSPALLAFDWPGFGRSPLLQAKGSADLGEVERDGDRVAADASSQNRGQKVQDYVEVLRAFFERHAVTEEAPGTIVAHGEGCLIALHFAAAYPDLLDSVILLCPSVPPASAHHPQNKYNLLQTLAREKGAQALLVSIVNLSTAKEDTALQAKVSQVLGSGASGVPPTVDGFLNLCKVMSHSSIPSMHQLHRVSTFVIYANEDSHVSPHEAKDLATNLHGNLLTYIHQDWHALRKYGAQNAMDKIRDRKERTIEMSGGHWIALDRTEVLAKHIAQAVDIE